MGHHHFANRKADSTGVKYLVQIKAGCERSELCPEDKSCQHCTGLDEETLGKKGIPHPVSRLPPSAVCTSHLLNAKADTATEDNRLSSLGRKVQAEQQARASHLRSRLWSRTGVEGTIGKVLEGGVPEITYRSSGLAGVQGAHGRDTRCFPTVVDQTADDGWHARRKKLLKICLFHSGEERGKRSSEEVGEIKSLRTETQSAVEHAQGISSDCAVSVTS